MEVLPEHPEPWSLDRKKSEPNKLVYRRAYKSVNAELVIARTVSGGWAPSFSYVHKNELWLNGELRFRPAESPKLAFEGARILCDSFVHEYAERWF